MSLEAAGLRLVEHIAKPAVFLVAEAARNKLCLRYARVSEIRVFVPRGAPLAPASALAMAWPSSVPSQKQS